MVHRDDRGVCRGGAVLPSCRLLPWQAVEAVATVAVVLVVNIYIVVDDNGGPRGWLNWSSRWRSSSSAQRRSYHVHAADFRTGGRGPADSWRSSARVHQSVGGTHRWRRGSGQASCGGLWISLFGQGQHPRTQTPPIGTGSFSFFNIVFAIVRFWTIAENYLLHDRSANTVLRFCLKRT